MNKSDEKLTASDIARQIVDDYADFTSGQWDYNSLHPVEKGAEAIKQLLQSQTLEADRLARIDEVGKLISLNERYSMSLASRHKIYHYINERKAELDNQKKGIE